MGEKKQDLRIQKTQRALATAMFSLLETTSFGKITVLDLCTEAMVSRSAFYVHFEDKYALARFCLQLLNEQMFIEYNGMPYENRIKGILESVQENKRILKNLFGAELDMELTEMMCQNFRKDIEDQIQRNGGTLGDLPGPPDVLSVYYASGVTSAILFWVFKSKPDPVEDMVRCLLSLLEPITNVKEN